MVIKALGKCIFHVHAKDAHLDPHEIALNRGIDPRPLEQVLERSWGYRTLGFSHSDIWWREFVGALWSAGYGGVLSIEHEDFLIGNRKGILKSVDFLKPILFRSPPGP